MIKRLPLPTLAFLAAFSMMLMLPPAQAASTKARAGAKEKVAFQISDADSKKLYILLNAASNFQKVHGKKNTVIELVAFGPGVSLLTLESTSGERIDAAIKSGVKIVVCEATMQSMNLTEADMLPGLHYVPGGIIELVQKQKEGYAYILP